MEGGRDGGGGCGSLLAASFVPLQLRRSVKTSRLSLRKGWIFRLTIAMSAKREPQPPPPSLVFSPGGKKQWLTFLYAEKNKVILF